MPGSPLRAEGANRQAQAAPSPLRARRRPVELGGRDDGGGDVPAVGACTGCWGGGCGGHSCTRTRTRTRPALGAVPTRAPTKGRVLGGLPPPPTPRSAAALVLPWGGLGRALPWPLPSAAGRWPERSGWGCSAQRWCWVWVPATHLAPRVRATRSAPFMSRAARQPRGLPLLCPWRGCPRRRPHCSRHVPRGRGRVGTRARPGRRCPAHPGAVSAGPAPGDSPPQRRRAARGRGLPWPGPRPLGWPRPVGESRSARRTLSREQVRAGHALK